MILLDIYTQVKRDFEARARNALRDKPELLSFILNHERREFVLSKMCAEIATLEARFGKKSSLEIRRKLVDGVTDMFIANAVRHKDESRMSDIAKRGTANKAVDEMSEFITEVEPPNASQA
jgi:hypothetical protein